MRNRPLAGERLKVLVLSTYEGGDANAVRDYLLSFRLHSRHDYYYLLDCRRLDGRIDLRPFDVILIFWDVYLLGPELSDAARERIARAPATKVVFLQDEYRDVRGVNQAMADLGIDHIAPEPTDQQLTGPRCCWSSSTRVATSSKCGCRDAPPRNNRRHDDGGNCSGSPTRTQHP